MSEFSCPVIDVSSLNLTKHPNADSLSIGHVDAFPVVVRTADFVNVRRAVYVPVDALVPLDRGVFEFLRSASHPERTHHRIKAVKLRGVFSMGLLLPWRGIEAANGDMSKLLGVTKYEEDEIAPARTKNPQVTPWYVWAKRFLTNPRQTIQTFRERRPVRGEVLRAIAEYDVENMRKMPHEFKDGESVCVTEKIHGCNARYGWVKGKFYIGSHRTFRSDLDNPWARAAEKYDLRNKVDPDHVLYGEVYGGKLQDLAYGTDGEERLVVFDVYRHSEKRFLNPFELMLWLSTRKLPMVPILYFGKFDIKTIDELSRGDTTLSGNHIREGVVVKPNVERLDSRGKRLLLKYVGEQYLLRKNGTERH